MDHYTDFASPAAIMAVLDHGGFVRTDVQPDHDDPPWMGRNVYLSPGDVWCDACRERIDHDAYGPGWVNVLARMKLKHGGTWCADCFTERDQTDTDDSDSDDDRTGRAFG